MEMSKVLIHFPSETVTNNVRPSCGPQLSTGPQLCRIGCVLAVLHPLPCLCNTAKINQNKTGVFWSFLAVSPENFHLDRMRILTISRQE